MFQSLTCMQFLSSVRLPVYREQEKARGAKANDVEGADNIIRSPLGRTGSKRYMSDVEGVADVLEMCAASFNSITG